MQQKFSNFFVETFHRLGLESPRYFKYWQWIGIAALAAGFIPDGIQYLHNSFQWDLPAHWIVVLGVIAKIGGAVTYLNNKLPVVNATKVTEQTAKLPVSEIGAIQQADVNVAKTPEQELKNASDKAQEVLNNTSDSKP